MGVTIQAGNLERGNSKFMKPIIYTLPQQSIVQNAYSMNKPLAERLIMIRTSKQRGMRMGQVLLDILKGLSNDVLITDIDAMFHPDYPIDVVKVLVDTCRAKPFRVLWPGSCEGGKLIYSIPGMADYKTYKIEDYDITVII